ncbi:hypothetical protein UFOVP1516_40 [uncultured Caudovirales phage]|uniref:Uncharacterized protein n=1 Tax=uncultured Caudovirales phage TaxID=2100421 RepID=A0A6J5PBM7_9CAUD|nr:hypothetical protein UFOVP887_4 [uncultured Caudovirales phage]CAB5226844.1 hypothetical protein UFOVP1516_40 [uncultured Caudovirales phage]
MKDLNLTGAYGRDYKSKKALLEAWDGDLDFRCLVTGRYITKKEALEFGFTMINFRYAKMMKCLTIYL